MIEFARTSTHLATLPSTLQVIREAEHAAVRPMLDFFHFYSGLSKLEDLDLLEPGELAHVHFQDLLAGPRELIDNNSRLIPGDGIAADGADALMQARGYAGPCRSALLYYNQMSEARGNAQAYDAAARARLKALSQELTGLA